MSAHSSCSQEYIDWLKSDPRFKEVVFKIHHYPEHTFPRICVKHRKQIVALDAEVDLSLSGEHVAPKKWAEMLENRDEHTLVIDVRNGYESAIGHFEGAVLPSLETFREFPQSPGSQSPARSKIYQGDDVLHGRDSV